MTNVPVIFYYVFVERIFSAERFVFCTSRPTIFSRTYIRISLIWVNLFFVNAFLVIVSKLSCIVLKFLLKRSIVVSNIIIVVFSSSLAVTMGFTIDCG